MRRPLLTILLFLLLGGVANVAVLGCTADGSGGADSSSASSSEPQSLAAALSELDLVFVPEMDRLAGEFTASSALVLTDEELGSFEAHWSALRPLIKEKVTPESISKISRWAGAETIGVSLAAEWLESMPMYPLRSSSNGSAILFGQTPEDSSVELPSHLPIVHRRLILAAVFYRDSQQIGRVFLTIQGWAEE